MANKLLYILNDDVLEILMVTLTIIIFRLKKNCVQILDSCEDVKKMSQILEEQEQEEEENKLMNSDSGLVKS